jgi:hypothetical protein
MWHARRRRDLGVNGRTMLELRRLFDVGDMRLTVLGVFVAMIVTGKPRLIRSKTVVRNSAIVFLILTLTFDITELICIFCFVFFPSVCFLFVHMYMSRLYVRISAKFVTDQGAVRSARK